MIARIKVSSMYYKIISHYKKLILQLMKIAYKIAKICILNISKLIYYDVIIFMGGQWGGLYHYIKSNSLASYEASTLT